MNTTEAMWSETDTARACQLWENYQREHDVAARVGEAVGIDPSSGRVWFGDSAKDIVMRMEAQGLSAPLFFLRVGQDYYARKGGRR